LPKIFYVLFCKIKLEQRYMTYLSLNSHLSAFVAFSSAEGWTQIPLIEISSLPLNSYRWLNSWGLSVLRSAFLFTQVNLGTANSSAAPSAMDRLRSDRRNFWSSQTLERIALHWRTRSLFSNSVSTTALSTPRFMGFWYDQSSSHRKLTSVWIQVLFRLILFCNVFGLIPGFEAVTGKAGFTLGLSFALWGAVTWCGVQRQGVKTVSWFLPSGPSWPMAPIFVLLERISYCFRALSLGVRLWANMLAGHQRIHLVTGIALVPALCLGVIGAPVTMLAAALLMALTGLESIVCVLQSGVFCLLGSFYLYEALHAETNVAPQA
jgi:ATP synthase subunit 6